MDAITDVDSKGTFAGTHSISGMYISQGEVRTISERTHLLFRKGKCERIFNLNARVPVFEIYRYGSFQVIKGAAQFNQKGYAIPIPYHPTHHRQQTPDIPISYLFQRKFRFEPTLKQC